jgi:hypothetical protein
MSRTYFGTAGHLLVADRCRFHLHTHVGPWCVSTVGEWYVKPTDSQPEEIGYKRLYETMVFRLYDGSPHDGEAESMQGYNTRDDADAGHEATLRRLEGLS